MVVEIVVEMVVVVVVVVAMCCVSVLELCLFGSVDGGPSTLLE